MSPSADLKSRAALALHGVRDGAKESMQMNPMKWTGIAAGTGLVLGLAGRWMQRRAQRCMPDLVIIDDAW